MTEKYTLEEARAELARRECMAHGHYWSFITTMDSTIPKFIVCDTCGIRATVSRESAGTEEGASE